MANEKRLTEKHWNGKGYYMLCSGVLRCDGLCGNCDELGKLVDRLGEYEDKADQPTVDAVEVVWCKDCAVPHNQWTGCPKLNGLVPPQDFYCAYGERKDNGKSTCAE